MILSEDFARQAKDMRVTNVRVWKDFDLIASLDLDEEIRRNQYSVSKSFTAVAVGMALQEGLLGLDERIADIFREQVSADADERLFELTLRDCLSMQCGFSRPLLMAEERVHLTKPDWVRYILEQPFSEKPGTVFRYTNAGPYLAGFIVQKRAGYPTLVDYLMPRLFEPLGIIRPWWECDPQGNTFGSAGIMLSVSDLGRFSLLLLANGNWQGKQLIPSEWINDCRSKHADNNREGYGYLFWLGPANTYRADGKYGQYGIVIPDKNAVVAVNAECRDQDGLLALIHRSLIPDI